MNKLSTCVRLKHIPTGIAVRCQEQRSQLQNRVGAPPVPSCFAMFLPVLSHMLHIAVVAHGDGHA